MNYQLEYPLNTNRLIIHIDYQLTDRVIELGTRGEGGDFNDNSPTPAWLEEIFELRGIEGSAFISRYSLSIGKGLVFSWDELIPNIIEIMRKYLDPEGSVVEVSKPITIIYVDPRTSQFSERAIGFRQ